MEPLKVSVVIPCFNQGHFLREALDSLEKSTYPHLEIIVIDDGSTDTTTVRHIEQLKGICIKGTPVIFHRQTNHGLPATRNNAIRMSTGQFILPLDSDDKVDETFIEKCVWVLTKHSDVSIVYCSVQHFGAKSDRWNAVPYDFHRLLHDNFMIATSMFRREVWNDVGGYDESLIGYEDWDFWMRAGAIGHTGYWIPEYLFFYRKSEVSMLVNVNKRRKHLVGLIRKKNRLIYRTARNARTKSNTLGSYLEPKLNVLKWRLFVNYVKIANKMPQHIKEPGKRFVKPLIRKVFGFKETLIDQVQELGPNQLDEYFESAYSNRLNTPYINSVCCASTPYREHLNILFVVPWLEVGGADKVNLDLAYEFTRAGHNVHFFTTLNSTHAWHGRFKSIVPAITHLGNWFSSPEELLDYVIDYIKGHSISALLLSNSQLGYQMLKSIQDHCPDVLLVDLNHMEEPYHPFDYFRYSVRYKEYLDHRVVITDYLKQAMVRKYGESPDRITVIPNGVNLPENYEGTNYPQKARASMITIGFVGRMEEQKQPLEFVKVARLVLKDQPDARFVLVGDGRLLPAAKELANSLGIRRNVEFMGAQSHASIIMKQKFDLLVAPSLREGLPIVGLEAMSLGIPIIASNVPGWAELLGDGTGGFLVDFGNTYGIVERCQMLINNADIRMEISKQGYDEAKQKYSIERTATRYIELFKRLTHPLTE